MPPETYVQTLGADLILGADLSLKGSGAERSCEMPSGHAWYPPKRRKAQPAAASSGSLPAAPVPLPAEELAETAPHVRLLEAGEPDVLDEEEPMMLQIARELWRADYSDLFHDEYVASKAQLGTGYAAAPSSYARRLQGQRLAEYERRMQGRERDAMAIALHSANMRVWTPSLLARSVTFFANVTGLISSIESCGRRLASKPSTLKFMRMMRDVRPPPRFEIGQHVSLYIADQTYQWVGMKKRGRRQSLERHDARGMPMAISHEVYVNSVKVLLPSSLGTLSDAAITQIKANRGSPYTEDYHNILDPLLPSEVDASLREFASDALAPVGRLLTPGTHAAALSIRQVASALYGRPNIDPGGASEFDILEPLMQTDTKSYEDFKKIMQHLSSHSAPSTVVNTFAGDGQSCIGAKNLKRAYPALYADWLIVVGGFHEHAHFMFAITEGFWKCLLCTCFVTVLGLENIREVTNNLEHNAYAHHQNGHHVVTIAIVCFLLQDVQYPPPALLLRDLDLYMSNVNSASAIVLLRYLRHGGFPTLQWQRAAREGNGTKVKKLFAYSFHVCRSVAHKPVCVQILLIGLLGYCCAHPELQAMLHATVSLSLLGRLGSNMYLDRLLEYINKIQQGAQRSANAASFGRALDLTSLLRCILHVRHAFQATELGGAESDDPVTPSMLTQARLLQNHILLVIGNDLTKHNPDNYFWHTGHAVPLDRGDYRGRQPWILIERVQNARSAGKGRARQERWDTHALRFVLDHFFQY